MNNTARITDSGVYTKKGASWQVYKQDKITADRQKNKTKYTREEGHIPVQPLRKPEDIQKAKEYFLSKPERYEGQNIRDYTIFIIGINIARRSGDLLNLKFHNIMDETRTIKPHISITEQKTGKSAKLIVTPAIKEALELYVSTFGDINLSDPLFPSRVKDAEGNYKPMTVKNLYYKMQALKKELGITEPLGTHSLRKSWAYQTLKNNPDNSNIVAGISKALNHSDVKTTFRYLGIDQEELDALFMDNQL